MKTRVQTAGGYGGRDIEVEGHDGVLRLDVDPDVNYPDDTTSEACLDTTGVDKLIEVLREWRSRNP